MVDGAGAHGLRSARREPVRLHAGVGADITGAGGHDRRARTALREGAVHHRPGVGRQRQAGQRRHRGARGCRARRHHRQHRQARRERRRVRGGCWNGRSTTLGAWDMPENLVPAQDEMAAYDMREANKVRAYLCCGDFMAQHFANMAKTEEWARTLDLVVSIDPLLHRGARSGPTTCCPQRRASSWTPRWATPRWATTSWCCRTR
ncbi:MAG: hypothetical protein ACLSVD_13275 [Eggerthellaceae bacterium]